MAIYEIDGKIVNTELSKEHYEENTRWNGSNQISVNTGSQWEHEEVRLSAKDHWYIVRWSDYQGSTPSAEFIEDDEAAKWLLLNGHKLPKSLKEHEAEICE